MTQFDLPALGSPGARYQTRENLVAAVRAADAHLQTQIDALTAGVLIVGAWDAASGAFPTTRPGGGAIQAGDAWTVSAAGTVDGVAFVALDRLIALGGGGASYAGNWVRAAYSEAVGDVGAALVTPTGGDTALPLADQVVLTLGAPSGGDDALAIQAAITAAEGRWLDGQGQTFRCDSALDLMSGGAGARIRNAVFDFSAMAFGTSDQTFAMYARGSVGTARALTENTTRHADFPQTVTVSAEHGADFAAGDYAYLTSDAEWDKDALHIGEVVRIESVSSGVLTLYWPTELQYLTASSATIAKLTLAEGVRLDGVTLIGGVAADGESTERKGGIQFRDARDCILSDCDVSRFTLRGVELRRAVDCSVNGGKIYEIRYPFSYGVGVFDACRNIKIDGLDSWDCRHCVSGAASNTYGGGIPMHVQVTRCNVSGTNAALDCHPAGHLWTFAGNHITARHGASELETSPDGIIWQGGSVKIEGNTITGRLGHGIVFQSFVTYLRGDVVCSDNICATANPLANRSGIYYLVDNFTGVLDFENFLASGNIINGPWASGIGLRCNLAAGAIKDFNIVGNIINGAAKGIELRSSGLLADGVIVGNNVRSTGAAGVGIDLVADTGGTVRSISISGGFISNAETAVLRANGAGTHTAINVSALEHNEATPLVGWAAGELRASNFKGNAGVTIVNGDPAGTALFYEGGALKSTTGAGTITLHAAT